MLPYDSPQRQLARSVTRRLANLSLDKTPVRSSKADKKENTNSSTSSSRSRSSVTPTQKFREKEQPTSSKTPPASLFARQPATTSGGPSSQPGFEFESDSESLSPTPSEIDALEESFYEFESQAASLVSEAETATLVGGDAEFSTRSSRRPHYLSSASVNYSTDAWAQAQVVSYPSLSSELDDEDDDHNHVKEKDEDDEEDELFSTPQSLENRLRLLWRKHQTILCPSLMV